MPDPICLDHNTTTPVAPEVFDATLRWLREQHGDTPRPTETWHQHTHHNNAQRHAVRRHAL
jgi:cysteine sulfinate desulfinase/cysteine desulfurase-like protein